MDTDYKAELAEATERRAAQIARLAYMEELRAKYAYASTPEYDAQCEAARSEVAR